MDCGWIKLHRKIIESDVFADPLLFKLWCLCLLKANHKTGHFKIDGVNMPVTTNPGQFITGRYELHKDFYKTKRKKNKSAITLWRKLQTLEKMEILNIKSCTKYSIISITNWGKYQQVEQQLNNKRTTTEQQLNTNKNVKNIYTDKLKTFVGNYIQFISKTYPTKSPKNKNINQTSLETIEKLIRLDGFDEDYVFSAIRWAQKDDFWKSQIYSLAGLRKKSSSGLTKFQNLSNAYDKDKPEQTKPKIPVFMVAANDR